jgi:biotin transporter BioY
LVGGLAVKTRASTKGFDTLCYSTQGFGTLRYSTQGAAFLASLGGVAAIYRCGALWLAAWLGVARHLSLTACLTQAWKLGVLPFVAVDVAKALVVAAVGGSGRRWLELLQVGHYG